MTNSGNSTTFIEKLKSVGSKVFFSKKRKKSIKNNVMEEIENSKGNVVEEIENRAEKKVERE